MWPAKAPGYSKGVLTGYSIRRPNPVVAFGLNCHWPIKQMN